VNDRSVRALLVPLTILAWTGVLVVIVWALSHVAHAAMMVVLATIVAFGVTPVVNYLARWIPRMAALAITYIVTFVLLVGVVAGIAYSVAPQLAGLVENIPAYAQQVRGLEPQLLALLSPFGVTSAQLDSLRNQAVAQIQAFGGQAATETLVFARAFLSGVVDSVLVLMLSVYFVANAPRVRGWVVEAAPAGQRRRAQVLVDIVNRVVGGYVRGTLTLATLVGVLVGAGMGVLHVRYAALLGVVAFFMEFVPVLGVFISGALCILVALFQSWLLALIVLGYFVVVHVIEGDLIGPRIMGAALGIHPAVALIALVAGTELFGLWGALLGAPIAGLLQAIVVAVWRETQAGPVELVGDTTPRRGRAAGATGAR
jgi:predicted PurR-regulated permease PerM